MGTYLKVCGLFIWMTLQKAKYFSEIFYRHIQVVLKNNLKLFDTQGTTKKNTYQT